jgi:hypothetical protein
MLEKKKTKYYESCKMVLDHEKNVVKTFSGKINTSDEEINNAHDLLLKYKSQSENYGQMYRYEISKHNKILDDNEDKYNTVFDKIKSNEESRIFFIKCNMEKFSKTYEEFSICSFDFLNVKYKEILYNSI